MKSKKVLALLLVLLLILPVLASCQKAAEKTKDTVKNVEMKYMTAEELEKELGGKNVTILDVRKAADYAEGHIPGAISADMDAVVSGGDLKAGLETMKKAAEGLDNTLVLVCYSGKRYAQAATNALVENGYAADKIVTLKDGMKNWINVFADKIEK